MHIHLYLKFGHLFHVWNGKPSFLNINFKSLISKCPNHNMSKVTGNLLDNLISLRFVSFIIEHPVELKYKTFELLCTGDCVRVVVNLVILKPFRTFKEFQLVCTILTFYVRCCLVSWWGIWLASNVRDIKYSKQARNLYHKQINWVLGSLWLIN